MKYIYSLLSLNEAEPAEMLFIYKHETTKIDELDKDDIEKNYDGTFTYGSFDYFFEEHQCPTNLIRGFEEIYVDGDEDKHGIFTYHKSVIAEENSHNWKELFNF